MKTTLIVGIGDPKILAANSVELRSESPNVGKRLIEQRAFMAQVKLKPGLGHNPLLNSKPKQLWEGAKYLVRRDGPISTGAYELISFFKSRPELDRPDIQGIFTPLSVDITKTDLELAQHPGMMFMGYQLRPDTTSSIHIGGASPDDAPVIDAQFLETENDRNAGKHIIARAREVFAQSPLADMITEEELPGAAVQTEKQVLDYAMGPGPVIYHGIGSCSMGPNDDDAVDSRLRARGVQGLRIVDTSVFPVMPSGNTAAPTMAIAWRAADLILEERSSSTSGRRSARADSTGR